MVDTVKSRPNFYEVLGLKPTASGDEIAQAFAREISGFRPRPIGGLAEVTVAYKTLRDPARRRAYDASLGLNQVREPVRSFAVQGVGAAFVLRPPAGAVERPAV